MKLATPVLFLLLSLRPQDPADPPPTVGMFGRLDEIVLPGSELVAKPLEESRTPLVVRIVNTFAHGTAFRYTIVYYGLEPGTYDLRDYLLRKDGSSTEDLPPIPVEVHPAFPEEELRRVGDIELSDLPEVGGYKTALVILGVAWCVGLMALIFVGRKSKSAKGAGEQKPLTLADRLRPLVEQASRGESSKDEQAQLERLLLGFWRKRLKLEDLSAVDGMAALKRHEEAGTLLRALERWLHRPGGDPDVDLAALLNPYANLPSDALEEPEESVP